MDKRYSTTILAKRAYLDLLEQLDGPSTPRAQSMLAERATWLHMCLQRMESDFARTGQMDWRGYTQLTLTFTTVLKSLGLFEGSLAESPLIQSFKDALARLPEPAPPPDHHLVLDVSDGPHGSPDGVDS